MSEPAALLRGLVVGRPAPAGPGTPAIPGPDRGARPAAAPDRPARGIRPAVADGLALGVLVVLSLALYLGRLGFSSDDFDFLRVMALSPDQSLAGSFAGLMDNPNVAPRPVQAIYQAVLYALFGTDPLGYHLAGAAVLLAMALLLWLSLRELGLPRLMTVLVPALFVVFPSYATDRFWFAAHGYVLAMATCFLSLYAELRTVRPPGAPRWRWKALALASLVVCGLGFEIALPFLALNVVVVLVQARRRLVRDGVRSLGRLRLAGLVAPNVALLLAILAYKAATSPGADLSQSVPEHLLRLFGGATLVTFGSYGAAMPHTAWWAIGVGGAGVALVACLVAAGVFAYVWHLHGQGGPVSRRAWLLLSAAGVPVFVLGYGIFLTTSRFMVTSTGIGNRWQIAGAVGGAMVLVGLLGWLGSLLPSTALRRGATSTLLALMIGSSVLVTNALATQWTAARDLRQNIVAGIAAGLPAVDPGTIVILDGACPYRGSAIVFDSDWDLAGALRLHYGTSALLADSAATGRMTVGDDALVTSHYTREAVYAYGPHVVAYDHRTGKMSRLTDRRAALAALGGSTPPFAATCATGTEGHGVAMLPLDRRIGALGG